MGAEAEPKTNIGIVVKRDEQDFADWVATEEGFLTIFGSYRDEPLKLEAYQRAFLRTPSSFRAVEKSRQTGYSFIFAC